jgi:GNAT superfamily N-acetyltransferase
MSGEERTGAGVTEVRELRAGETALAFEALRALRPHLADAATFARDVDELQRPQGYRIVAAFDDGRSQASAAAGFRILHSLAYGRFLYVDDLSTLPAARRRGHAGRLLAWLEEEAAREACASLQLDSGVGPERQDAHRLYFATGMRISSHHFMRARE